MRFIKIDKDSYGTILASWAICAGLLWATAHFIRNLWIAVPVGLALIVFMVFITWFFRIPDRAPLRGEPKAVTAVADGKIVIVKKVYEGEYLHRDCIQVSTYMDFFDVHANFWPVSGEVSYYRYHPGPKYLAFLPKSSERNEHASTGIRCAHADCEVFFKQIAGTFARRIVCYSEPGRLGNRGEQCGVIKFGSRIDLFLPLGADVRVRVGDRVEAVRSVIATLP